MDDAVEQAKHSPNPMPGPIELEIRQVYGAMDSGDALTPELAEQEQRLRDSVASPAAWPLAPPANLKATRHHGNRRISEGCSSTAKPLPNSSPGRLQRLFQIALGEPVEQSVA